MISQLWYTFGKCLAKLYGRNVILETPICIVADKGIEEHPRRDSGGHITDAGIMDEFILYFSECRYKPHLFVECVPDFRKSSTALFHV